MKRIVIDTNVLVASAYNPQSASRRIVEACLRGELTIILSSAIEREYRHIVPRAVRKQDELTRIAELISRAERVEPEETPRVVPEDPEDDKLLAAAVAGAADALVTNDGPVLRLDPYQGVRVLRPAEFVEQLGEGER